MRALVIHQFGDPRQLRLEEVPTPAPTSDELLVAIHAAAINPSDVKNVAGVMHGTILPRIPGRDFAGIVAKGPPELLGREVWGTGGEIGFTRDGTHAEFILLPRAAVALKPSQLPMDSAAAAGVTFVTAWSALVTSSKIDAGQTAVIIGAAGGVGSAALQIAKAKGARVIAVVRSDRDAEITRTLGADDIINSKTADFIESINTLTNRRGAHILFDTSGMLFAESVEAAATNARIPIITAPKDGNATFNLRNIYRKTIQILGVDSRGLDAVACAALLTEMSPYFQSGQFTIPSVEPRPLEQAIDAYLLAAQGGHRIVLQPTRPEPTP